MTGMKTEMPRPSDQFAKQLFARFEQAEEDLSRTNYSEYTKVRGKLYEDLITTCRAHEDWKDETIRRLQDLLREKINVSTTQFIMKDPNA